MNDKGSMPWQVNARDLGTRNRPALREHLVVAVLAGDDAKPEGTALSGFLAAESNAEGLLQWFGSTARDFDTMRQAMARDIATIDALVSDLLDAILHHQDFKRLEASWRGVAYLVDQVESDEKIKVKLLNATWAELVRDFDRATEFDQSMLFAKVYSDEYDMPGGLPYGLLLCDYAVRHRFQGGTQKATDDVSALTGLAQVAAAAFAPCVISAAPELFGVPTFADLSHTQMLDAGFQLAEYRRWQQLQEKDESKFLGVLLPRILLRDMYRSSHSREDGFCYRERMNDINSWLWGNAVYGLGAVAMRAFHDRGWFADIRGTYPDREEGGLVADLPAQVFSTREAGAYRRALEVELTDKKQKKLEEMGFIALSPCSYTKSVVFLGMHSLHAPAETRDPIARSNSHLSSMLQYVLCVSRFAHYIKIMARDRVGVHATAEELEKYLNDWLRGYMIGNAEASADLKARYPLSAGSVEVSEMLGRPGFMSCIIHLQPHFQFDQVVTGFKLRTEFRVRNSSDRTL